MIQYFCPRWGFEKLDWKEYLLRVKLAGFNGIEWFPFGETCDGLEFLAELKRQDLQLLYVFAVRDDQPIFSYERYLQLLQIQLRQLLDLQIPGVGPLHISIQTGREFFSTEQILECLHICRQFSDEYNIPIYQETHRNKWSYAAHLVYPILQQQKDLELTLDISHWFCVSESYLQDQHLAVQAAIDRSRHLHARVGNTQSPQVYDPSLPAHNEALMHHLEIWDQWVAQQKNAGRRITITPEFGPPPYLVVGSNNKQSPVERQWQHNLWMLNFLKERYL